MIMKKMFFVVMSMCLFLASAGNAQEAAKLTPQQQQQQAIQAQAIENLQLKAGVLEEIKLLVGQRPLPAVRGYLQILNAVHQYVANVKEPVTPEKMMEDFGKMGFDFGPEKELAPPSKKKPDTK